MKLGERFDMLLVGMALCLGVIATSSYCASSQVVRTKQAVIGVVAAIGVAQDAEGAAYKAGAVPMPAHHAFTGALVKVLGAAEAFENTVDAAPSDKAALKAHYTELSQALSALTAAVAEFFPEGPTKAGVLVQINISLQAAGVVLAAEL